MYAADALSSDGFAGFKHLCAHMQRQKAAMEAHAAQEERHEQGKRRAKLEAGFAEVVVAAFVSCICMK